MGNATINEFEVNDFVQLLDTYQTINNTIFDKFGVDNAYGDIDILTHVQWNMTKSYVCWIDTVGDGDNDDDAMAAVYVEYGTEILTPPVYYLNFVLLYVDDCCGSQYYMILDINMRDETMEADET